METLLNECKPIRAISLCDKRESTVGSTVFIEH